MADKLRWGILSTAGIARNAVIPGIHESNNGEVVAVASRDLAKGRAFAEANGIPKAYGSYEELLADPAVDAIYNPLPNDLHAEWSIKAADAGKPVLCEKPLTVSADEARRMLARFKANGLLMAEACMYRFHPQTARVQQMVADGAVGELHIINAIFSVTIADLNDIRYQKVRGGGCVLDLGYYPINLIRLIAGAEPNRIAAFGRFNDDDVDTRTIGALSFESGVAGHFDCDFQGEFGQSYDIRGTKGRIVVNQAYAIAKDKPSLIQYWHDRTYEEITIPAVNHYTLMVEDFGDALLNGRPPRFAPEEAVSGMETLEKIIAQASANRL